MTPEQTKQLQEIRERVQRYTKLLAEQASSVYRDEWAYSIQDLDYKCSELRVPELAGYMRFTEAKPTETKTAICRAVVASVYGEEVPE